VTIQQRLAPAHFSRFRAREREAKKERKRAKKKEREKSESAECERKKCEFAVFPSYIAQHWKTNSKSLKRLG
jgi:hypothetical protein